MREDDGRAFARDLIGDPTIGARDDARAAGGWGEAHASVSITCGLCAALRGDAGIGVPQLLMARHACDRDKTSAAPVRMMVFEARARIEQARRA
jgi:hypothetical protein